MLEKMYSKNLVSTDLYWVDSRWAALQGSLCVLSTEWAEVTEDTLELLTKPKAARRPAATRLVLKPGGRRPDWLALGSRDLEAAAWGWVAAVAGAGAWWVKTSSVRKAQVHHGDQDDHVKWYFWCIIRQYFFKEKAVKEVYFSWNSPNREYAARQ